MILCVITSLKGNEYQRKKTSFFELILLLAVSFVCQDTRKLYCNILLRHFFTVFRYIVIYSFSYFVSKIKLISQYFELYVILVFDSELFTCINDCMKTFL